MLISRLDYVSVMDFELLVTLLNMIKREREKEHVTQVDHTEANNERLL